MGKPKLKFLAEEDLQAISDTMGGLLDKQAAVLASKEDLHDLEARMNNRMDEGFESVMAGIDAVAEKLTEKEKFDRLLEWAKEVGEKVGVKPQNFKL